MGMAARSARLVTVTDEDEETTRVARGAEIKRRRLALGIKSPNDLAKRSGVYRDTVQAAENGKASVGTYERLEAFLDEFDSDREELEADEATTAEVRPADFMELEVTVDAVGLHIIGKGSSANMDEVRRQIADLYREIRGKGE